MKQTFAAKFRDGTVTTLTILNGSEYWQMVEVYQEDTKIGRLHIRTEVWHEDIAFNFINGAEKNDSYITSKTW